MIMDAVSVSKTADMSGIAGKSSAGRKTTETEQDKKLKKACTDFESMLFYQLLKTMRQTIPKSGVSSSGHGKETYEMMFDQKIADEFARKRQGMGLQQLLYKQMSRISVKKD